MFFLKTHDFGCLQHQSQSELFTGIDWAPLRRDSVSYNCLQGKRGELRGAKERPTVMSGEQTD